MTLYITKSYQSDVPRKRTGRPPLFKQRGQLTVFLETKELATIRVRAQAAGLSTSSYARDIIRAALRKRPVHHGKKGS